MLEIFGFLGFFPTVSFFLGIGGNEENGGDPRPRRRRLLPSAPATERARNQRVTMSTEELHLKTVKSLKKDELKAELEKRGLETTGLKKVLRERLEWFLRGPNLNLQTSKDVASLPEEELREEVFKRNLETGGSVTTLRERLTDAITHVSSCSVSPVQGSVADAFCAFLLSPTRFPRSST